jgi:hypothetical protein
MTLALDGWALREFDRAELGDRRLNQRALRIASAQSGFFGASIPRACVIPAEIKGCYRMLSNESVTHEGLLSGHLSATIDRASSRRVVLAIEDGTSLSFPAVADIDGLGPISTSEGTKGLMVHTTLLVDRDSGETLGVVRQDVWARPKEKASPKESGEQRKKRTRESEVWARGTEGLVSLLGSASEQPPRVISVFDREGDAYETLVRCRTAGAGFVIRAVHNRKLAMQVDGEDYSIDAANNGPILGHLDIQVPRRDKRPPRQARLTLRATKVTLLPPKNIGRKGEPIALTMVVVQEEGSDVPKKDQLCWVLLTDEPVETLAQARGVVDTYRLRWRIEEFHMGLKTGCGCERIQLQSAHAITNFLALATVTSWRVLCLRDAARELMPLNSDVVSPVALKLLKRHDRKLPAEPGAREIMRAIARLGGFLSRKSDGEPGWRTIWRGFQRLREWETGARLMAEASA